MLQIDTSEQLRLTIQDFVGKSVAVLGITGSGKTNTAAVLVEELLSQGLPMTIVDIEGEYWGLKEKYDLLIVGRSEHAELAVGPENAAQLATISVERGISIILDLSEYTQEETYEFLVSYFKSLWEACSKSKQPYQIVLEEAHEFIPQSTSTPLKQLLTRIALRGRKRGLGIILMSQRSAKVEKDVLTQTALLFLHKVIHPVDMKIYKDLIPLPGVEVEQKVSSLQPGQVIIISQHVPQVAQIRLRHTFHAGATPEFGIVTQPELRRIDEAMLHELQAALATPGQEKTGSSEAKLTKRIKELEALLAEKDAEIVRLLDENALLSKLSVSVNGPEALAINQATVHPVIESLPIGNHGKPVQVIEAPPLNEKKFATFKKRIDAFSPLHLELLQLLTEKDRWMTVGQMASWLNRSENPIRNNPPYDLIRMKLIAREKYTDGYHYHSLLCDYLEKEFPGVDVDTLIQRLFHG